jgi:hypothetical protein
MACLIPRFEVPARISEEELMMDNLEKETTAPSTVIKERP